VNADTAAAPGEGFLAEVPEQPLPETPAAVVDVDVLERISCAGRPSATVSVSATGRT
jgi:hypothetical protein